MNESLRDLIRRLPSIVGQAPDPDFGSAPEDPRELFLDWFRLAISTQGTGEPHAATLSTVDRDGAPDARVLILKDVTEDFRFVFATSADSPKAWQMLSNPDVALSFYWSPLARAVRVRGRAERLPAAVELADWNARSQQARESSMNGRQSAVRSAEGRSAGFNWSVWGIRPSTVEFWHGSPDRNHQRLRYTRHHEEGPQIWTRNLLWP